jgi:Domain of unknown function (DUF4326)
LKTVHDDLVDPVYRFVVNKRRQPFDVYIGRPSKWGNPFTVEQHGREGCIERFREYIMHPAQADLRYAARTELRGKVLGCFCSPLPCHGDVLAEIANAE